MAAATLEQEMGRRSVAEAIRPIRERTVALSSSAERAITQEMVAEACDTLVRERYPASPPVWPESSGIPAESQLGRTGETGVLTEPPLPQRKSASTPRFHPIFRFNGGGVLGNAWRRHPSRPITPGTR